MSDFRTASELLAAAHGTPCAGELRCFYCGSPADGNCPLDLRSSFNDWWNVATPASSVICNGCDISLQEKLSMPGRDKAQKTRNWSWLITPTAATPVGDIAGIRRACLVPPVGAWALAIAVSGQKHVVFRTPANSGEEPFSVQLETQTVVYRLDELNRRLALAKKIAAASGKPALSGRLDSSLYMRLEESCTEAEINDWFSRAVEPVSRLAAHLCPPKEECQREQLAGS